ncbi:TetR family transcriptional regulator [Saxibacter everestensis]|uniref:TetR family transcriptional regulator n=1 Tax=Saxibacter everestensis TaxID=2909229 RepID=A0ABY8QVH1_9MICO|nr:TetR family transcriptional regulator [Brevibacteriaceae bacterium ZFBP1038]
MRIASEAAPATGDLNTKAKIRDAAIGHFARDGFQKTNLRAIAATAGVSAGLVIHHFGSKQALRTACDDYVLGDLIDTAHDKAKPAGLQDVIRKYLENPAEHQVHIGYLARAVSEETPTGHKFVDSLVDETEAIVEAGIADGSMRQSSDPRGLAVLIVATSLGMLTMNPPLANALGYDGLGPELMRRMAVPALELYTYGLYTDDSFLKATREAFSADEEGTPTTSSTTR